MSRRGSARRWVATLAALLVVALLGVGRAATVTEAQWTDEAHGRAQLGTGYWAPAAPEPAESDPLDLAQP